MRNGAAAVFGFVFFRRFLRFVCTGFIDGAAAVAGILPPAFSGVASGGTLPRGVISPSPLKHLMSICAADARSSGFAFAISWILANSEIVDKTIL